MLIFHLDWYPRDAINGEAEDAGVGGGADEAGGSGGDPRVLEVAIRIEQHHRPPLADAAHRLSVAAPARRTRVFHDNGYPTQKLWTWVDGSNDFNGSGLGS